MENDLHVQLSDFVHEEKKRRKTSIDAEIQTAVREHLAALTKDNRVGGLTEGGNNGTVDPVPHVPVLNSGDSECVRQLLAILASGHTIARDLIHTAVLACSELSHVTTGDRLPAHRSPKDQQREVEELYRAISATSGDQAEAGARRKRMGRRTRRTPDNDG